MFTFLPFASPFSKRCIAMSTSQFLDFYIPSIKFSLFSVYLCLSLFLFLFVWLVSVYSFSLNHSLSLVQSPSSIITVLWDVKVCLTTASEYLHFQQSCFCIWDWMQSLTISAVQQFYANNVKTNILSVFTQELHIIIFVQKVLLSVKIFLHYFHQISLKITFSWYCK